MKFIADKNKLLNALQICNKALSPNGIVPILACYLLEIKKSKLTVFGNDLKSCISHSIEISAEDDFSFAVNGSKLLSIVKKAADAPIIFTLIENILSIKTATGTSKIPIEDTDTVNKIQNKPKHTLIIPASILEAGISKVLFACDKDISLPLGGVLLEINNDKITFTGCNRHVLSTTENEIESNVLHDVLLPNTSASILLGLPLRNDISIIISTNSIGFYFDSTSAIFLLIDEKYPDWRGILNLNSDIFIEVNRFEFKNAINRAITLTNRETQQLKITLSNDRIDICGEDIDLQESATETIPCNFIGDFIIGANGMLITECLNRLNSENVVLQMSKPSKPIYIREINELSCKDLMLVMPIMLTN